MLVSCSQEVIVYDIDNSTSPQAISNKHRSVVNTSVFNHNSRVIATGGGDGIINFFNSNLDFISSIEDEDLQGYEITSLNFNNNSNFLAYSSILGHLKIWDLKTSHTQLNFKLDKSYITSMTFNPDSTVICAGTDSGNLNIYNISSYTKTSYKYDAFQKINMVKYSPFYNNFIAMSLNDGSVRIYDTNSNQIVDNFTNHDKPSSSLCFSPINKLFLCSVGMDSKINFYDIVAKKLIKPIVTEYQLTSVSFNNDGVTLAIGTNSGLILLYDLRSCSSPKEKLIGHSTKVNYLEFSKKAKSISMDMTNKSSKSMSNFELNNSNMKNNSSVSSINNSKINDNKISKFDEKKYENIKDDIFKESNVPSFKEKDLKTKNIFDDIDNKNYINNTQSFNNANTNDKKDVIKNNLFSKDVKKNIENDNTSVVNNKKLVESDLDKKIENIVVNAIDKEMNKLKNYIHDEFNALHIDLIRQFEIQHDEMVKSMKNLMMINNKMSKEFEKIKKENVELKSKFF